MLDCFYMANKQKKKRNKKYSGADARVTTPQVTRVSAEERSALKEWWLNYGRMVRLLGIAAGAVLVLGLVIVGIIGLL